MRTAAGLKAYMQGNWIKFPKNYPEEKEELSVNDDTVTVISGEYTGIEYNYIYGDNLQITDVIEKGRKGTTYKVKIIWKGNLYTITWSYVADCRRSICTWLDCADNAKGFGIQSKVCYGRMGFECGIFWHS